MKEMKNIMTTSETLKNSKEFIGLGIPSFSIYKIQHSNIFPILDADFSINDSRPTSIQIIDKHLDMYKNVWQALS